MTPSRPTPASPPPRSEGERETIAFHAAAPGGERGYVMLLEPPDESGWVRLRRWDSPDYTAPPQELRTRAEDVGSAVRREAKAGWSFTLPPERILAWLAPPGR